MLNSLRQTVKIKLLFLVLFCPSVFAQHSPWFLSPTNKVLTISAVSQRADTAFIGTTAQNLPNNGQLNQTTYWLNLQSGLVDRLNVEISQGYSIARFDNIDKESDLTDTSIGLSFQAVNEYLEDSPWIPSIGLHLFTTIGGNYQTQQVNAIGDGADSLEISASFGKIFPHYGIYGDIGLRDRQNTLPNELFWNIALFASITPRWSVTGGYQYTNAEDDVDRSDAVISLLEEDTQRYSFSIQYQWLQSRLSLGYSHVFDGRNTPESDIYSFSISQPL